MARCVIIICVKTSSNGLASGASTSTPSIAAASTQATSAHAAAASSVSPLDNLVKIPQPTIERLSAYLQCVRAMRVDGITTASSSEIATRTGINAAQFRKDLSYFGEFGKPGLGYNVAELEAHLSRIMGLDTSRDVLLVGVGNLGRALLSYMGFAQRGFRIAAAFDVQSDAIGEVGCPVYPLDELARVNQSLGARIGVVAVPREAAQEVADQLVKAGVMAILNFAPISIAVPEEVVVRNVDFTSQLEVLSYYLRPR